MANRRQLPPPTSFTKHRNYLEPIGPATALIDAPAFATEASAALDRAREAHDELVALLNSSSNQDEVSARCSVDDIAEEVSSLHTNNNVQSELRKWHEKRLFPAGHGVDLDDEGGAARNDDDEEAEELTPQAAESGEAVGVFKDATFLKLVESADKGELGILKPIDGLDSYLRKTKIPDYNVLRQVIPSGNTTSAQHTPLPSVRTPLSDLLYTISFHPIPRVPHRVPFNVKYQTLHCLGSTTLWELRENVRAGGDTVPAVIEDEGDSDDEGEDWRREKKRPKWSNERRIAGSVWGIEGVLYADQGAGKVDYSEMILDLIESTTWDALDESRDSPGAETGNELDSDGFPSWTAGPSMQDTAIGSLDIKIGQPYWYMHQGNCEHVWTVDSIRRIHPSDPKVSSPDSTSTHPYPITTYLSRGGTDSDAQCRLCDRGPGTIITLDDELAGESPTLLCVTCFEMLHGDNADGHVLVVPIALLIGTWTNCCFYAVELVLAYRYFSFYWGTDGFNNYLVLAALVVDTVGVAGCCAMIYQYCISYWGNQVFVQGQYWPFPVYIMTTSVSAVITQSFLISRVWGIFKGPIRLVVPILAAMALVSFAGAIWTTYIIVVFNSLSQRGKVKIPATFWLVISGACDVSIALSLVWQLVLVRRKTLRFVGSKLEPVLTKLIRNSIETGTVTATVAVVAFVAYITSPETNVCGGIAVNLGRIYTLSMLVTLLGRRKQQDDLDSGVMSNRKQRTQAPVEGISCMLWTLELLQSYRYFTRFSHDEGYVRGMVSFALLVDTVSVMGDCACVYLYTVSHWGETDYLLNQYWPIPNYLITTGLSAAITQSFLVFRTYSILRGKFRAIIPLLSAMIAVSLGGAIWTAAIIIKYSTYANRNKVELPVTVWLVTSGVADVSIALTLVWQLLLVKKKTVRISTESRMIEVLNKLVRNAIETGSVTATVAIIAFCCYITNVESNVSVGIAFTLLDYLQTTFRGAVEADEEHSVYKVKTDSLRDAKEDYA
ncbi:small nuclear RNA activating complex, polypeptide 3, 50kDa [Pseudohyphozyma bogoriensis]|nr:small nuclear RNA activating complex, polypeptide 3, 50kDa [Pseudohyphozyma bogoriensis]